MKVTVITAIYGGYEELKPAMPQIGHDVDFLCLTDDPELFANGWQIATEDDLPNDPNMAGKFPKCCPWAYCNPDVGASIWIDASFRITSRNMVADLIARAHPIAQFLHPDRDCIYEEARASMGLERYRDLPLQQQIDSYTTDHPAHWGLWAAGVIARRHDAGVRRFGAEWIEECERWGVQDQVSEPFALRRNGLRPASLPNSLYSNPWLSFEPSKKHIEGRK